MVQLVILMPDVAKKLILHAVHQKIVFMQIYEAVMAGNGYPHIGDQKIQL